MLGTEILGLERQLDAAFAQRKIDQIRLDALAAQFGAKQGMLRRTSGGAAPCRARLSVVRLFETVFVFQERRFWLIWV